MPKRRSLSDITARRDEAEKAVAQITGPDPVELVTVSYNLPADIVDVLRRLARQRADAIRAARARGEPVDEDARQSASKIVLGALEPHMADWLRELGE
ncbi:MAG: hypothetical protein AAGI03_02690 [Pseudomonadota bacterium]